LAEDPAPPAVSIVLPVLDAATTVVASIRSALDQDYAGPLDVVVAHGPSRDGTAEVLAQFAGEPRVTVIDNPSGGTAAGLNLAIAASSGAVVARCDAHAVLPPGYVARAVAVLAETGADNVGGVQAAEGETTLQRAIAVAQTTPLGVGDARYRTGGRAGPTDTVYLGVFRRTSLERAGGFDESLARSQDAELNYRLRAAGGVVHFDPELQVAYRPRRSLRALWRQYFGYGRWKRAVVRKHPRALRWRQLVPPVFVIGLIGSAALLLTPWRWAAVVVPGAYLLAVFGTTIAGWVRRRSRAALLLPLVLPVMHLAWGLGFLIGPPRR
jgi:glycosyltransferase involved in cell wall biosynthesis